MDSTESADLNPPDAGLSGSITASSSMGNSTEASSRQEHSATAAAALPVSSPSAPAVPMMSPPPHGGGSSIVVSSMATDKAGSTSPPVVASTAHPSAASSSQQQHLTNPYHRQGVSNSSSTKKLSVGRSSNIHHIPKLMGTIRLSLVVAASLTIVFGIFFPSVTYYGNDYSTVKSVYNLDTPRRSSAAGYQGSMVENYVMDHSEELGYTQSDPRPNYGDMKSRRPRGCEIWKDDSRPEVYDPLHKFRGELRTYNTLVDKFQLPKGVTDLRHHLNDGICDRLQLHPNGLQGIFPSGVLSHLQNSQGYIEPLLPPLRDSQYCFEKTRENLLSLGYLVHDFAQLCTKLKRHSRIVLVDMGASLSFHKKDKQNALQTGKIDRSQPAMYLTSLYEKFGFVFDHIYAFEVKSQKPATVYEQVPQNLMGAYHWINVGVSAKLGDKLNPLTMLLDKFDPEDDIVIVKLDIDTSSLEVPLAFQILNDPKLNKLISHFYFEHHVHIKELQPNWTGSMNGTVAESLQLFRSMRERGIGAHYWV